MTNNRRQNLCILTALWSVCCAVAVAAEPIKLPQWKICEDQAGELSGGAREHKLEEALAEAKICNQPDAYPQSDCLFELGVYFTDVGKTALAEKYFFEAADLKNAHLHKSLFAAEYVTAQKDKPMYLPAYGNAEQEREGKIHDLANCLSWLGRAYTAEKKYDEAADAFGRAIALIDTSKDPQHEAIILPETLLRAAKVQRLLSHFGEAQKMEEKARLILHKRVLDNQSK